MLQGTALAGLLFLSACGGSGSTSSSGHTGTTTPVASVSVSLTSIPTDVICSSTLSVSALVQGSTNTAVTWSVDGITNGSATVGTISGTGDTVTYSAPASEGSHQLAATSVVDPTKSASAKVSVHLATTISSVSVTPTTWTLSASTQKQFAATVTGAGSYSSGVTWSAQRGSVSSTGLYTAPSISGSDVVTVTSVQTPGMAATAIITVSATPSAAVPSWTGTGNTIFVAAGSDIQAAIDTASAGDTLVISDGTWTGVQLTINRMIRLKALNHLGARLQGYAQPTNGTDNGITVKGSAAAGTFIQDLDVSWYGNHSIGVWDTGNVVISGCNVESSGAQGIFLWDTVDVVVYGNFIRDPYLAGMVPTLVDDASNTNWTANNSLVLMDYGVQAYGTVRTQVLQNYFYGQFNQVVSFKEGNRDYAIQANTFEGFAGTGILCGQNVASYGPYAYSRQNKSLDTGTLHVEGNVFRPVVGLQVGQLAEYRGSSAIRIGHLNQAAVYVSGNIIEAAITGLSVEMGINGSAGGPTGTLYADHNIINGNIWDDGAMVSPTSKIRMVGRWQAVQISSGVLMNVIISNDTYANFAYAVQNNGMSGTLSIDRTIFLNDATALSGTGAATNSLFYPNSALPGLGNIAANPQVNNATVPLRRYNENISAPTSDLTSRFHPGNSSPAILKDATFIGAVSP